MSSEDPDKWFTPPELAKQLGISSEKVLTWIRNGELRAVNVAAGLAGRPRWRISSVAFEEFLKRRESGPPVVPRRRGYTSRSSVQRSVVKSDDGRLAKNIPHEERVKRIAVLIAARRSGHGAEWRPFVSTAVARYAEKTGISVDEAAVKALKAWWEKEG